MKQLVNPWQCSYIKLDEDFTLLPQHQSSSYMLYISDLSQMLTLELY